MSTRVSRSDLTVAQTAEAELDVTQVVVETAHVHDMVMKVTQVCIEIAYPAPTSQLFNRRFYTDSAVPLNKTYTW